MSYFENRITIGLDLAVRQLAMTQPERRLIASDTGSTQLSSPPPIGKIPAAHLLSAGISPFQNQLRIPSPEMTSHPC
jgi:hypothetical protein